MNTAIRIVEKGLVPKPLLRRGIRRLLKARLQEQERRFQPHRHLALQRWVDEMRRAPVALVPDKANEQHYEVPAAFYDLVLGPRRKYSSAYYPDEHTTLEEAEVAMLARTVAMADLQDGQDILELGCGWGSLSLYMAETFPRNQIVGVSNSNTQRAFIMGEAERRGLSNLSILTRDMNAFETQQRFDRIVSVEMFEHMRNWEELLRRAATWMRPDGRLFLHVFAHREYAYPFEVRDSSDWMSEYFFTGGMMPSHDLLDHLDIPFEVEERQAISGMHYARTAEDWLRNQEKRAESVLPILAETYGEHEASTWFHRWRVFFLACAELFAYDNGSQWLVSHNRLRLKASETNA